MDERDKKEMENLDRLLRDSAGAWPALEPDPHLPTRVRARAREREAARGARPASGRRWGLVTAGAAALAVAALVGGYVGYRAGIARAPATTAEATVETGDDLAAIDAFWSAWSQDGFADELTAVDTAIEVEDEN